LHVKRRNDERAVDDEHSSRFGDWTGDSGFGGCDLGRSADGGTGGCDLGRSADGACAHDSSDDICIEADHPGWR